MLPIRAKAALAGFLIAAALPVLCAVGSAREPETRVPAARVVIYPGDIINDSMLEDISVADAQDDAPYALSRRDVVGKASGRTLLPGYPIPLQALVNPRVIRNGAVVKMMYVDGPLSIETIGAAMQDGGPGDWIHLRNVDSGVPVEGRVQADGTVLVGGG